MESLSNIRRVIADNAAITRHNPLLLDKLLHDLARPPML